MFTVKDVVAQFGFKVVAGAAGLENEIQNVTIGDLLSWVMGRSEEKSAWITIQGHSNIVAVALLTEASCIIIAENSEVFPETIQKADQEGIPVLTTQKTQYEIAKLFCNAQI